MRALVIDKSMPRLAATKLLSALTPRAFVGPALKAPYRARWITAPCAWPLRAQFGLDRDRI